MVLNGPEAMDSAENSVELIDPQGTVLQSIQGSKELVASRDSGDDRSPAYSLNRVPQVRYVREATFRVAAARPTLEVDQNCVFPYSYALQSEATRIGFTAVAACVESEGRWWPTSQGCLFLARNSGMKA